MMNLMYFGLPSLFLIRRGTLTFGMQALVWYYSHSELSCIRSPVHDLIAQNRYFHSPPKVVGGLNGHLSPSFHGKWPTMVSPSVHVACEKYSERTARAWFDRLYMFTF